MSTLAKRRALRRRLHHFACIRDPEENRQHIHAELRDATLSELAHDGSSIDDSEGTYHGGEFKPSAEVPPRAPRTPPLRLQAKVKSKAADSVSAAASEECQLERFGRWAGEDSPIKCKALHVFSAHGSASDLIAG